MRRFDIRDDDSPEGMNYSEIDCDDGVHVDWWEANAEITSLRERLAAAEGDFAELGNAVLNVGGRDYPSFMEHLIDIHSCLIRIKDRDAAGESTGEGEERDGCSQTNAKTKAAGSRDTRIQRVGASREHRAAGKPLPP